MGPTKIYVNILKEGFRLLYSKRCSLHAFPTNKPNPHKGPKQSSQAEYIDTPPITLKWNTVYYIIVE